MRKRGRRTEKKQKKKKEEEEAVAPWYHLCFLVVFFLFSFSVCFFFGTTAFRRVLFSHIAVLEVKRTAVRDFFGRTVLSDLDFNNYLMIQYLIFILLFANMNDIINDIIREQLFVGIQFCFNIYGKIMHWPRGWGPCWV